jgi:hypothetical protein
MIHLMTESSLDGKIQDIYTTETQRVGGYANLFSKTYNAIQQEFLDDEKQRYLLKLVICLVMISMQHDVDVNRVDSFIFVPHHHRIFYDKLSIFTNKYLNREVTENQFVDMCVRLQLLFVNWSEEDQQKEDLGIIFAAASRDKNSPYYGLHDILESVFLRIIV